MINRDLRFVFIHIPKNAGTSIEYALFSTFKSEYNLEERAHKKMNNGKPNYKGLSFLVGGEFYRMFGARKRAAPQHRLLHEYKNVEGFFSFAFVRNPWARALSLYKYGLGRGFFNKSVTFEEFLREFPHPQWLDRYHDKKQIEYVRNVNFVGKVENLQEDFNTVSQVLSIKPVDIPRTNITSQEHYSKSYNATTRDLVAKLFFQDIEKFDYKFEE